MKRILKGAPSGAAAELATPDPRSWPPSKMQTMLPSVQPIIATRRKVPFDDSDWLFDFKYDGFRGLCYLQRNRNRFISVDGNGLSRFDTLADQVAGALEITDATLDDEVIVADATGRPRSTTSSCTGGARLRGIRHPVAPNDTDLRPLPLSERRRRLQVILPEGSPVVSEPLSVVGRGSKLFELVCGHDLEGIVAKRLRDPYNPRVRWLKIKNPGYSQQEGRLNYSTDHRGGRRIRRRR